MKATEIRFIKGRLKFKGAKNSAPFPSAIIVFKGSIQMEKEFSTFMDGGDCTNCDYVEKKLIKLQQKITTLENKFKIAEEALETVLNYPKSAVYNRDSWCKVAWEIRQLSGQALAKIREE
jgi:hypothetical protein